MKKLLLIPLILTSFVLSHAQPNVHVQDKKSIEEAAQSIKQYYDLANQITQTNITHTSLNQADKEAADHWGLDEKEWLSYKKYMELEGKYFYEKLDPLNVMALMTQEPNARKKYITKHLQFERQKVGNEIAFANDLWRVQQALYGNEPLLDFSSLPWMDGEAFDRRTVRQNIPNEPHEAQQVVSYSDSQAIEYEPNDELWAIVDENCTNCNLQIKTLVNEQPLKVVVISLTKDPKKLQKWSKESGINDFLRQDKIRLEIFDPLMFHPGLTPKTNDLYHARSGHVLRKL